ncbi:MAG: hypothetical protein K8F90_14575, partial [Hyphomicrobiales bacterium]|nr:hypothetical protein [Hyphomicrobiales bacterium]
MKASRLGIYSSLALLSLLFALPIIWLVWTSLKLPVQASAIPPVWVFTPQWSNYVDAWSDRGFSSAFLNTIVIGIGTVIVSILFGLPMGYSLARSPIRGKRAIGIGIL